MAKDGDIVDFLFGTIFKFFAWIIGGIVKLTVGLIIGLFKGIVSLFKGNNDAGDGNNSTSAV